jgi:putative ABC transport system ATP-binding protein
MTTMTVTTQDTTKMDSEAMAQQKALLQLEGITKVFETEEVETHALSDVHFSVRPGEWVSIVGPSGSGKTTLLAVLGLLDTASRGTYLLDGRSVLDLSPAERALVRNQHIGFIFQSFNLIGDLSVYENVELPLTYRGMPADERRQRVERALERVGMGHRARHMPGQLSGGQQQRVAVARAVAGDPLILLADEPTGNLDSKNGEQVMQLLSELHKGGATLIMVTHDPNQARLGTRTVSLFDGRVVQDERIR